MTIDLDKFSLPLVQSGNLDSLVGKVIGIVLIISGLIAFSYLIYGGLGFITSGGDATKVTNARNTIMYAIVGIIVVALSYLIFTFVVNQL